MVNSLRQPPSLQEERHAGTTEKGDSFSLAGDFASGQHVSYCMSLQALCWAEENVGLMKVYCPNMKAAV